MNQADLHPFLMDFFKTRQAEILEQTTGKLTVKLTERLDQQLMNRPFYWQYVKKLGLGGETMQLTFLTDKNERDQSDGEWVHYGSPRLEQIFRIIQQEGTFTTLFESRPAANHQKTALQPWFVCNLRVKYRGYRPSDEIVSIGILLLNGTMRFQFMEGIETIEFSTTIPDYCFTLPTIISVNRALNRVTDELEKRIKDQSKEFTVKSYAIYQRERDMVRKLKDHQNEEEADHLAEQQIYDRLYPQVDLQWINSGIFYLSEETSKKLMKT